MSLLTRNTAVVDPHSEGQSHEIQVYPPPGLTSQALSPSRRARSQPTEGRDARDAPVKTMPRGQESQGRAEAEEYAPMRRERRGRVSNIADHDDMPQSMRKDRPTPANSPLSGSGAGGTPSPMLAQDLKKRKDNEEKAKSRSSEEVVERLRSELGEANQKVAKAARDYDQLYKSAREFHGTESSAMMGEFQRRAEEYHQMTEDDKALQEVDFTRRVKKTKALYEREYEQSVSMAEVKLNTEIAELTRRAEQDRRQMTNQQSMMVGAIKQEAEDEVQRKTRRVRHEAEVSDQEMRMHYQVEVGYYNEQNNALKGMVETLSTASQEHCASNGGDPSMPEQVRLKMFEMTDTIEKQRDKIVKMELQAQQQGGQTSEIGRASCRERV